MQGRNEQLDDDGFSSDFIDHVSVSQPIAMCTYTLQTVYRTPSVH